MAAVYDRGLGCGLFAIEDMISWSDRVIEVLENPPFEFIELSLMSSAKMEDVRGKLYEFYRNINIDLEYIVNILLGVINSKLSKNQLNIEEAIACTSGLLVHTDFYSRKEYYELYRCEDAYYLATQGTYGYLKDVYKEFTNAICQYESYYSLFTDFYTTVMESKWELK